jgi:hypothetical protein
MYSSKAHEKFQRQRKDAKASPESPSTCVTVIFIGVISFC